MTKEANLRRFFFGLSVGWDVEGVCVGVGGHVLWTSPAATLLPEAQGKNLQGLTEPFTLLKTHLEDSLYITVLGETAGINICSVQKHDTDQAHQSHHL